ncbi:MAG: prolyl oligopeptidase family serine peptidase [Akkermansiaceae bacterium]|jgi:alpha-beta hydrolase superfamily lysophospholipase|nr:prolyl oligopeptidase family serine peptidase [Akkermansiaceae bacterium]
MNLRSLLLTLATCLHFILPGTAAESGIESFEIQGHKAYLKAAPQAAKGKPWIWYAPNVKGDFIILRHRRYVDAFLHAGIAIASCDLGEVRGAPESTAKFGDFHTAMVARGYSPKPILLGQSRGGLMTLAWAVRNPEKVRAWVGIYPVCNLTSYPLRSSKAETLADYGMSEAELRKNLDEFNPVSRLEGLAKLRVPLFSVHGDKDVLVPFDENTGLLQNNYKALGGPCTVKVIPGGGHEISPAFFECEELIDFILQHAAAAVP